MTTHGPNGVETSRHRRGSAPPRGGPEPEARRAVLGIGVRGVGEPRLAELELGRPEGALHAGAEAPLRARRVRAGSRPRRAGTGAACAGRPPRASTPPRPSAGTRRGGSGPWRGARPRPGRRRRDRSPGPGPGGTAGAPRARSRARRAHGGRRPALASSRRHPRRIPHRRRAVRGGRGGRDGRDTPRRLPDPTSGSLKGVSARPDLPVEGEVQPHPVHPRAGRRGRDRRGQLHGDAEAHVAAAVEVLDARAGVEHRQVGRVGALVPGRIVRGPRRGEVPDRVPLVPAAVVDTPVRQDRIPRGLDQDAGAVGGNRRVHGDRAAEVRRLGRNERGRAEGTDEDRAAHRRAAQTAAPEPGGVELAAVEAVFAFTRVDRGVEHPVDDRVLVLEDDAPDPAGGAVVLGATAAGAAERGVAPRAAGRGEQRRPAQDDVGRRDQPDAAAGTAAAAARTRVVVGRAAGAAGAAGGVDGPVDGDVAGARDVDEAATRAAAAAARGVDPGVGAGPLLVAARAPAAAGGRHGHPRARGGGRRGIGGAALATRRALGGVAGPEDVGRGPARGRVPASATALRGTGAARVDRVVAGATLARPFALHDGVAVGAAVGAPAAVAVVRGVELGRVAAVATASHALAAGGDRGRVGRPGVAGPPAPVGRAPAAVRAGSEDPAGLDQGVALDQDDRRVHARDAHRDAAPDVERAELPDDRRRPVHAVRAGVQGRPGVQQHVGRRVEVVQRAVIRLPVARARGRVAGRGGTVEIRPVVTVAREEHPGLDEARGTRGVHVEGARGRRPRLGGLAELHEHLAGLRRQVLRREAVRRGRERRPAEVLDAERELDDAECVLGEAVEPRPNHQLGRVEVLDEDQGCGDHLLRHQGHPARTPGRRVVGELIVPGREARGVALVRLARRDRVVDVGVAGLVDREPHVARGQGAGIEILREPDAHGVPRLDADARFARVGRDGRDLRGRRGDLILEVAGIALGPRGELVRAGPVQGLTVHVQDALGLRIAEDRHAVGEAGTQSRIGGSAERGQLRLEEDVRAVHPVRAGGRQAERVAFADLDRLGPDARGIDRVAEGELEPAVDRDVVLLRLGEVHEDEALACVDRGTASAAGRRGEHDGGEQGEQRQRTARSGEGRHSALLACPTETTLEPVCRDT